MNITVLGWYGNRNVGDESYKLAFPILFPSHSFTFINNPKHISSSADLIILGGGDVVKPTFTRELASLKVPKLAMSVTLTGDSDLANLSLFDCVVVRDELSLSLGTKYHNNIQYLPDFSFALTPDRANGKRILVERAMRADKMLTPKVLTIVLNSYIAYNHDDAMHRDVIAFEKLLHELARLCESIDSTVVFLPFSTKMPWDDRATSLWLCSRCKKKSHKNIAIADEVLSVGETLDIIAASDGVISTRFHSTIFSTLAGTPFFDIYHHSKNEGFLNTLGKREAWGTFLWEPDFPKMNKTVRGFLTSSERNKELENFTRNAKEQLSNVWRILEK